MTVWFTCAAYGAISDYITFRFLSNHLTHPLIVLALLHPFEPPDLLLHPFINGVLTAQSRAYQSAAFQIITGHAFDATYSSRFHKNASDNTTCPHCSAHYTIDHVLFDCDHFWYERVTIIECDKHYLLSTLSGGKMLTRFLHAMQSLLRPLPTRNDPPDPTTA